MEEQSSAIEAATDWIPIIATSQPHVMPVHALAIDRRHGHSKDKFVREWKARKLTGSAGVAHAIIESTRETGQ